MKRLAMIFGILLTILSLNACINTSSPDSKVTVQVEVGKTAAFKVTTMGGTTTWKLNNVQVATGNSYTFSAVAVGTYTLTVTNGTTVTWNINVYTNDVPFYRDADGDGYGNPNDSKLAAVQPAGYVADKNDCDDTDAEINPNSCADGAVSYCQDGVITECPLANVPFVTASDVASGKTNIEITWTAVEGATSYNVYMTEEADGEYGDPIATVTGTTYTLVENWQDIINIVGPTPRMYPDANEEERAVFAAQLVAYRESIAPYIHSFKKEKWFKVQACTGSECGEMSNVDQGQAEYIHTAAVSDLAEVLINVVGYPLLICLADSPVGAAALDWDGKIVPSALGLAGQVDGSVDGDAYVHVIYQDYKEAYMLSRIMIMNGEIGGQQNLIQSGLYGVVEVDGTVVLTGSINAEVFLWSYIGGTSGKPNEGTIDVTYKGATYQFPLPVQPE